MSSNVLIFSAVFFMTVAIISMIRDFVLKDHRRITNRVEADLRSVQREIVKQSALFKQSKQGSLILTDLDEFVQPRKSFREWFDELIVQSGQQTKMERVLVQSALLGGCGGIISYLIFKNHFLWLVLTVCGLMAPTLRLMFQRKIRQDRLRNQLPEAFDLMARVIRAGQTINQAILAVADEFPRPISEEFSYCFEQQNLGLSPETAVRDLARRTGVLELRIFVTALIVQQQTGGNLAELIDKLSTMIRQRFRIMGQIRTLTAEGRLQAIILLALPVVLFFVLLVLNRDYEMQLLEHPVLIYTTLTLMTFGALWIRKIVNFDF